MAAEGFLVNRYCYAYYAFLVRMVLWHNNVTRCPEMTESAMRSLTIDRFPLDGSTPTLSSLARHAFGGLVQAVSRWRERNRMWDELSQLDGRELADLGLSRSDIPTIVAGHLHPSRKRH